ncbi:MAG TPA: NAD-dependent epimerase/dehydratase family protein [Anaerolineae bacterium]|nr:NAD-dependent epimerase/dehydratase family protein [Anaerolineae bacterium]HQH38805.1 NAD-dependent epimerase/dehydratase family protein [Anaerolineae bacterium]
MASDLKGQRVLVTGGAGFVGSNLVRRLVAEDAEVTILDDFFTGRLENLRGIAPEAYRLVRGSVTDSELVRQLVSEAEFIFHLAARNIIASTRNPYEDFKTNIGGTLNVLLAARDCHPQRVLYTSSVSVYGNPRYLPINEDDRISLLTPYAVSKYSGEGYCQAFYESYGVPVVVVRYSNVYGPWQDPQNPYCGVVAKFMQRAQAGMPLEIHGDGQQTRDFTFVEDAVEATIQAALSPKSEGEVFNIGTGVETSVEALAHLVSDLYGLELSPLHIDRRDIDNIRRRVVNIEKIRRILRWTPNVTLAKGLYRTQHWNEEHTLGEVAQ